MGLKFLYAGENLYCLAGSITPMVLLELLSFLREQPEAGKNLSTTLVPSSQRRMAAKTISASLPAGTIPYSLLSSQKKPAMAG